MKASNEVVRQCESPQDYEHSVVYIFKWYFCWYLVHCKNRSVALTQVGLSELQLHYQTMCKQVDQKKLQKWHKLGNNGNQESLAIKAVIRRLGYAGQKLDHQKAVRSFVNSRDVFESLKPAMESLNGNEFAPESPWCWQRFFFPGSFLCDQNLWERQIKWHYCVPQ